MWEASSLDEASFVWGSPCRVRNPKYVVISLLKSDVCDVVWRLPEEEGAARFAVAWGRTPSFKGAA